MSRVQLPFLQGVFLCLLLPMLSGCSSEQPRFVCGDAIGCVEIGADEPIRIGVIQALSGKVAALGKEQIYGLELALDKRLRKIAGHDVLLQTEDTGCTAEGGANAALKVVADPKTVAIFGTTCSGAAATAAKVMSDAGLTMISGNNSAPFLTAFGGQRAPDWQPGYFRTAANEENSGKAAATYAYTVLGVRKAAVINDGDIYTRGLTDGFKKAFVELGGSIVLDSSVNKGDTEMVPVLTAAANGGAELIFFPLFQPEGNHLLRTAKKIEALGTAILMSDGALIENTFIAEMGELARGMYFVGPSAVESEAGRQLAELYREKFKTDPSASYYQSAYDAAELLFQAIEKVAVKGEGGRLYIGRQALRDELYGTVAFAGVTGSLTCDQFGDCAFPVFDVLRLDEPGEGVAALLKNVQFTYSPAHSTGRL
ncbi:MAG: ABC transporter substrate-binding protein [Verrucomicrobia bacterium GWF2_62_7]|nr:MAG: ABC transporter substrate-binding protein [Verrucomicrobia bacterium GWF2_62_7]